MKITLYEFLMLSEQEQYNIIFNEGTFLNYKLNGNQKFALYAIDRFFVEVEYNNAENKLIKHTPFTTGKILDKYANLDF